MVLRDIEAGASADEAAELNRVPVEKVREWAAFYTLESLSRNPSKLTIRDRQQVHEQAMEKLAAAHPQEYAALLQKERAYFEEYRATPEGREGAAAEWRRTPQWKAILRKRVEAAGVAARKKAGIAEPVPRTPGRKKGGRS
jgi:hypothetical protein